MRALALLALMTIPAVQADDVETLRKELTDLRAALQEEKLSRMELEVQIRDLRLVVKDMQAEMARLRGGPVARGPRPQPKAEPEAPAPRRKTLSRLEARRLEEAWNRGGRMVEEGRFDEAIGAFSEALKYRPDAPAILFNRGFALNRVERHEEALRDLDRVLELGRNEWQVHFHRGLALHGLERYDESIKTFLRSTKLDPTNPSNHTSFYNVACGKALQGKKEEAIRYLKRAVQKGFDDFEHMEEDSDLESLRGDPRFEEIFGRGREL